MIGTKKRAKYQRCAFLLNLTPKNQLPNCACKIECRSSRVQANQEFARARCVTICVRIFFFRREPPGGVS
jgi:hypothetical protein